MKVGMEYLIEEKMKECEAVFKDAFHKAVVYEEVTLRFNKDKKLEIVNTFNGCSCSETEKK